MTEVFFIVQAFHAYEMFPQRLQLEPGIIDPLALILSLVAEIRDSAHAVDQEAIFFNIEKYHFDSVYTIRNLLKDKGKLLISIPTSRGDLVGADRDTAGRLMIMRNPWDIQLLFERTDFQLINYWENDDSRKRKDIRWTTMLFSYRAEQVVRPIDKIEGVLNRDKFRPYCNLKDYFFINSQH